MTNNQGIDEGVVLWGIHVQLEGVGAGVNVMADITGTFR